MTHTATCFRARAVSAKTIQQGRTQTGARQHATVTTMPRSPVALPPLPQRSLCWIPWQRARGLPLSIQRLPHFRPANRRRTTLRVDRRRIHAVASWTRRSSRLPLMNTRRDGTPVLQVTASARSSKRTGGRSVRGAHPTSPTCRNCFNSKAVLTGTCPRGTPPKSRQWRKCSLLLYHSTAT